MSERIRLKGKVEWTNRLFDAETWTSPEGKTETTWSVLFFPDDNYVDVLYDLQRQGMKNRIDRDPDKGFSVRFKRPTEKLMKGEMKAFEPPKVTDAEGKPWDKNVLIGNGSEAFVDIVAYSHHIPGSTSGKKAKAVRLEAVQILNLVTYGSGSPSETEGLNSD